MKIKFEAHWSLKILGVVMIIMAIKSFVDSRDMEHFNGSMMLIFTALFFMRTTIGEDKKPDDGWRPIEKINSIMIVRPVRYLDHDIMLGTLEEDHRETFCLLYRQYYGGITHYKLLDLKGPDHETL